MAQRTTTLTDFGAAPPPAEAGPRKTTFEHGEAGSVLHPQLAPGTVAWRDYQVTIAKVALESNTMVVLPTGLGKTVIAGLVAAECLMHEPGRILVLAPTRPLCLQHETRLKGWLQGPPPTVGITGKRRSRERRALEAAARVVARRTRRLAWRGERELPGGRGGARGNQSALLGNARWACWRVTGHLGTCLCGDRRGGAHSLGDAAAERRRVMAAVARERR